MQHNKRLFVFFSISFFPTSSMVTLLIKKRMLEKQMPRKHSQEIISLNMRGVFVIALEKDETFKPLYEKRN